MLWRGATSAWLHVGAVATIADAKATAAVVQALLRGMVLALVRAIFAFCLDGGRNACWIRVDQQCN